MAAGFEIGLADDDLREYDYTIVQGFSRYLCFGLPPGSFEGACIAGEYYLAESKASAGLRSRTSSTHPGSSPQDIVANLIEFVDENLPEMCRGGPLSQMQWCRKGGLKGVSADQRMLVKLSMKYDWITPALKGQNLLFNWATGDYEIIEKR